MGGRGIKIFIFSLSFLNINIDCDYLLAGIGDVRIEACRTDNERTKIYTLPL